MERRPLTLSEIIHGKPVIHTREIRLSTYHHEASDIIVEGTLIDESHAKIFDIMGKIREPGIIHHMVVRLLIKGNPLRIALSEVEMHHVPMDECRSVIVDTIEKVTGLKVRTGYSNTIRKNIGGKNGCTHLAHLMTVMGQEIVHGWLTHQRGRKAPLPADMENFSGKEYILNSCRMWAEGGPRWNRLEKALQSRHEQPRTG